MSAADLSLSKMKPLNLESDMITIHVGGEKRKRDLHVHKDLICSHSPFFKAALSNDWKEAQEGSVELPDDDYDIVTVYVQWLYRNKVFYKEEKEVTNPYSPEMNRLASLYIFDEKIGDVDFKDAVMDAINARVNSPYQEFTSYYPGAHVVARLYNNTPESSPVRRLLVDYYVWHGTGNWVTGDKESVLPKEFLRNLSVALLEDRRTPKGWLRTRAAILASITSIPSMARPAIRRRRTLRAPRYV